MNSIFGYFSLAIAILGSISAIQSVLKAPTVTGAALYAAIAPDLSAVQSILPHVQIPAALVQDICNVAADAINQFYHKVTTAPAPPAA